MTEYQRENLSFWNELTDIHEKSSFYDLASFKQGRQSLHEIELKELGDVREKSLLHLQCHFGMDTLSFARLGARVTGVDFSDRAINLARSLSAKLGLDARFIQSEISDLPQALQEQFDIVFTSYGVLCWLKDLSVWANTIRHFLKDGGTFLIVEEHPLSYILDEKCRADDLKVAYSYFDKTTQTVDSRYSYTGDSTEVKQAHHYEWTHTLGEIFTAIINSGLTIDSFREYPYCMYQKFGWLVQGKDGWWHPPENASAAVPLLFSLKASKKTI